MSANFNQCLKTSCIPSGGQKSEIVIQSDSAMRKSNLYCRATITQGDLKLSGVINDLNISTQQLDKLC